MVQILRGPLIANACITVDNKKLRLNACVHFKDVNFYDSYDKIPFDTIYSENLQQLRVVIARISQVWNVKTGHGSMNG